ncbi:hypothetical protein EYZ11_005361 [Aspergillus tanneri]|uniref:Uncharacterized protein n=1 Tax=Aspergillus tanneri TaxID=1220188 RepID=A0A4S3JKK5_9EURO|nr:hypothetical protein EYZ11_005361 [Aspergillus tanneri]
MQNDGGKFIRPLKSKSQLKRRSEIFDNPIRAPDPTVWVVFAWTAITVIGEYSEKP